MKTIYGITKITKKSDNTFQKWDCFKFMLFKKKKEAELFLKNSVKITREYGGYFEDSEGNKYFILEYDLV